MLRRTLEARLRQLGTQFPAVFLTGPRQSGKTTLARATFPQFVYRSLEDLQNREEAIEDPRGFLRRFEGAPGVILDEVQRAPELFSYLQQVLDEQRSGPYVLTGSQHFLLTESISQSLAGRAVLLELLPLSMAELLQRPALTPEQFAEATVTAGEANPVDLDQTLVRGLFPRLADPALEAAPWLDSYLRTYVERDVRTLANVGNLEAFGRFLGLCAGRSGQLVNSSALAVEVGVSHPTIRAWLSVLQASYVITLLRPHYESFNKRLIKTPKLYFTDTGLLCHLLGIRRPEDLPLHPLRGAIFETFVVSELTKLFLHHGRPASLYFWREAGGKEVDAVLDLGFGRVAVEIKAGETLRREAFKGLDHYRQLAGEAARVLVYGGAEGYETRGVAVRPWWQCT